MWYVGLLIVQTGINKIYKNKTKKIIVQNLQKGSPLQIWLITRLYVYSIYRQNGTLFSYFSFEHMFSSHSVWCTLHCDVPYLTRTIAFLLSSYIQGYSGCIRLQVRSYPDRQCIELAYSVVSISMPIKTTIYRSHVHQMVLTVL